MASTDQTNATDLSGRLSAMYGASVSTVRARLGSVAALYGANAIFGLAFTLFAAMLLASLYAPHPLFDRAVGGNLTALLACLREGGGVSSAITWAGIALALVYFVASEYLAGGLLERLRDGERVSAAEARRRFGAGGAAHLGRFLRLWVWSWVLWVPAIIVLAIGARNGSKGMGDAVQMSAAFGKLVAWLWPGLVLAAWASAAGDFARLLAVREPALGPRKTFFRAAKLVVRQPAAFVHFVSYVAAWLLASGVYVLLTLGHPYAGALGAWLLFVLRQVLVFARVALRVGAFGGQGALLDG